MQDKVELFLSRNMDGYLSEDMLRLSNIILDNWSDGNINDGADLASLLYDVEEEYMEFSGLFSDDFIFGLTVSMFS